MQWDGPISEKIFKIYYDGCVPVLELISLLCHRIKLIHW